MGIAERKAREKQGLRQEILDAARQMFAEEGFDRVSMRRLAERIEYSPTAIYLHFDDKNALFRAVCDETFAKLVQRLEKQRRQLGSRPLDCLKAGLKAYIEFGLRHPDHYIVTFMQRPQAPAPADAGGAGAEAFNCLRRAVTDCVDAGLFRPVEVEVAAQLLWVSVHGLVSLLVARKPFPFVSRQLLIDEQVETLVRGLLE